MAFSGALQLTDLDDFLAPSQACILPVKQKNKVTDQAQGVNPDTDIHIDAQNNYYEVAISSKPSTAAPAPTLKPTDKAVGGTDSVGVVQVQPQGAQGKQLEKAEISLNDCLACSGCVTSTESMLITLQSHLEVQTYINAEDDHRTGILTISPQTLASLVASYTETPSSSSSSSSSSCQGLTMTRLLRRIRSFFSSPDNGGWAGVWDTTFARHLSLMEHVAEYKERRLVGKGKQALTPTSADDPGTPLKGGGLPMLASACPGWVCYAEKAHGDLLDFVSHTRSSQGVMGSLVKQWWAAERKKTPKDVYHVTVMPCYDKKLEASRSDFYSELYETRDVDCVLTTGELDLLLRERGFNPFQAVSGEDAHEVSPRDSPFPELISHSGTSSGSYLHTLIDALAREHQNDTRLVTRPVRGSEDHVEYILEDAATGEIIFKGAKCYGFRNLQNLVRKVGKETGVKAVGRGIGASKLSAAVAARRRAGKAKLAAGQDSAVSSSASSITEQAEERTLDYVEVMACPGGCVNGGGQMKPKSENAATAAAQAAGRDEEGYNRDWETEGVEAPKTQIDEGMRWSTKSWVAKVEKVYWSGLPTPPQSPKADGQDRVVAEEEQENRKISAVDPQIEIATKIGQQIIETIVESSKKSLSTTNSAEIAYEARINFLRTRYRKVEGDVSGLTAKW